jgi:hypothetical protein
MGRAFRVRPFLFAIPHLPFLIFPFVPFVLYGGLFSFLAATLGLHGK